MQTEQIFRLLRKNPLTKSGYEIGGYARMRYDAERQTMVVEHAREITSAHWSEVAPNMIDDYQDWIRHDAIDIGIKVGDDWWFEGDIIGGIDPNGELYQDQLKFIAGGLFLSVVGYGYDSCDYTTIETMQRDGFELSVVGNIHEGGE